MREANKPGVLVTHPRLLPMAAPLSDAFTLVNGRDGVPEDAGIIAVISMGTDTIDAALINRLPHLRMIASPATGLDGIDLETAAQRGIIVTNGGNVQSEDVADLVLAFTLAARQRLAENDVFVRGGQWHRQQLIGPRRSLSVQRVGIVGMGHIGKAVARKIAPFCPEIGWWAPRSQDLAWPRHESLLALAQWSDILILCARGDVENVGMIDAEVIAAVGADGLIVNVARGFLIDEDALIAALKAGRLGQAALDVFSVEPADPERWRDVPNTQLSPHAASLTSECLAAMSAIVIGNVRTLLTGGEPRNIILPGN